MKIKFSKKATSVVEAMVVMLVIVSGVTGMYRIYNESIKLSNSTTNKLQAIQIASQGIEAFTNIRDTNWLLFSSDNKNCWNTLNYDSGCIGNTAKVGIENGVSYIIYTDSNKRWELDSPTNTFTYEYSNNEYRNYFLMYHDSDGIYTQTGTVSDIIKPIYTRELKVNYLPNGLPTDQKIKLTSIVQRVDSSSSVPHKVELEQVLTNWKK